MAQRIACERVRGRTFGVCVIACTIVVLGCPQQVQQKREQSVVATVDGVAITKRHFEEQLARDIQPLLDERWTRDQIEPFKQPLLESMINEMLIAQAAKKEGIRVTDEEVRRTIASMKDAYSAKAFEDELTKAQTDENTLEQIVRRELLVSKYLDAEVFSRLAVSNEAIEFAYADAGTKWDEPEQVRALHIVVGDIDLLKRISRELASGKKFGDLARMHSKSPEAKSGGDLGFFARGQMPAIFDDVVFRLRPGQTSEIVTSDFGFHLFRLLERRPARVRTLREVRSLIEKEQLSMLRSQAQDALVQSLRKAAHINIHPEVLAEASLKLKTKPGSLNAPGASDQSKSEAIR